MILSFHPCFIGDRNIICAGRSPGTEELSAIKAADAVILPQGCRQSLYEMARDHCGHVFPGYDARFQYPGKIEQIRLFRKMNLSHPKTCLYGSADDAVGKTATPADFDLPWVFKFPWGGEGESVFLIESKAQFEKMLDRAVQYEKSGQTGFLIQEYIPTHRSLRIVRIGETVRSYWRVMDGSEAFGSSLAAGASVETEMDPKLQQTAIDRLDPFCKKTGIDLAGFDVLYADDFGKKEPLFIEINYFFGRTGLGGSENFYRLLETEIKQWLDKNGFASVQ
jgi:ribosomal protein S6--L-glutamate ligase